MNSADALIVVCFLAFLIRGAALGLVQQVFSTSGFIGGLFAGAFLQHKYIQHIENADSRAIFSLLIVLGMGFLFLCIGELIGSALKMRIHAINNAFLSRADKIGGSIMGGVTLAVFVWLISGLAANVPNKTIQQQVRSSYVVQQLNQVFPDAPQMLTRISQLINPNGFPKVFVGHEPALDTTTPLPDLGHMQAGAEIARASVVKIAGRGCGGIVNGSGFVAGKGIVITNAHVVAGVERPDIIDGSGTHSARAIWFDPDLDIAILQSDGVREKPLVMLAEIAANGTPSAALGFPGGGDFTVSPATVLDSFTATGRNIYDQGATKRAVYSLKTAIHPGNSGGPLINANGAVIGVIFAESTTYDQVGYALSMDEVLRDFSQAQTAGNKTVGTGSCST